MLIGVVKPETTVRTARFGTVIVGPGACAPASLFIPEVIMRERPKSSVVPVR
jgi:hypothetical protein